MSHFIQADARHLPLTDKCIQCVVTSPPYWGLRDYGHADQIGLEPTLAEYLRVMVEVFREVRRVLRDDGTLWLNMGDGFSSKPPGCKGVSGSSGLNGAGGATYRDTLERGCGTKRDTTGGGFKPKDLLMQPHRLAIALQEDGWYVRMDNVWAKPNPMPESVTDRPTKSHEYVFLLTKNDRYFYDAEAVRVPCATKDKRDALWGKTAVTSRHDHADDESKGMMQKAKPGWVRMSNPAGRNLRSVWTMTTRPCKETHFATFPIDLPLRCIKAGTSEKGCCPACGAPWKRIVEKVRGDNNANDRPKRTAGMDSKTSTLSLSGNGSDEWAARGPQTISTHWLPTCKCPAHEPIPCTVLDPFGGAATTALAAKELGRRCIIVELKFEYLQIGQRRLANHQTRKVKVKKHIVAKPEPTLFTPAPLAEGGTQ